MYAHKHTTACASGGVHVCTCVAAVATDRVANLLLAYKGRSSFMASSRAAEDIARQMAREVLVRDRVARAAVSRRTEMRVGDLEARAAASWRTEMRVGDLDVRMAASWRTAALRCFIWCVRVAEVRVGDGGAHAAAGQLTLLLYGMCWARHQAQAGAGEKSARAAGGGCSPMQLLQAQGCRGGGLSFTCVG